MNLMVNNIKIAQDAFSNIVKKFPNLTIKENKTDEVELSIALAKQNGLKYEVQLCLQNSDELHFSVEHFWLSWFPCTNPEVVKLYIETVTGFLAGKYRILEHYRGTKCVKAEIQKPQGNGWQTFGTCRRLYLPTVMKKTYKEIQNV
jgi:hypothetical protein